MKEPQHLTFSRIHAYYLSERLAFESFSSLERNYTKKENNDSLQIPRGGDDFQTAEIDESPLAKKCEQVVLVCEGRLERQNT